MMRKFRSFFRSPMGSTILFMVAVLLLMTGTIGGVRAAPQIFNPNFGYGGMELDEIGVSLMEKNQQTGETVLISSRNYNKESQSFVVTTGALLENMLPDKKDENGKVIKDKDGNAVKEDLKLGYPYDEVLTVYNSGEIPEYVRVEIYKYWLDGTKKYDKIPTDLIELHLVTGNGWVLDSSSSTNERTILYYTSVLDKGKSTTPFTDKLTINGKLLDYADRTETASADGKTISWVIDGKTFQIEVEVDAVQNHNAAKAVHSVWGRDDVAGLGVSLGS